MYLHSESTHDVLFLREEGKAMLFKSLAKAGAKKACTGSGGAYYCYVIGRKYYNSAGKLVLIY